MSVHEKADIRERVRRLNPEQRNRLLSKLQLHPLTRDGNINNQLVAHVVMSPEADSSSETVSHKLKELLPAYMLPKVIKVHSKLPTTPNGKIDRVALSRIDPFPKIPSRIQEYKSSSIINQLQTIFQTVLAQDSVDPNDDFFHLGGDSISAIRIVTEIRKAGFEYNISQLFREPSIAGIANQLQTDKDSSSNNYEVLLSIWKNVLQLDVVDPETNFFEAGGDSILAITLVSKLRSAGYSVSISELFKNPTPETLNAYILSKNTTSPTKRRPNRSGKLSTAIPFTPIQSWFFEQNFDDINHWNQSLLIPIPRSTTEREVINALREIYKAHDVFRLAINKGATGFSQRILEPTEKKILVSTLSSSDLESQTDLFRFATKKAQSEVDLSTGNLLRAIFIQDSITPKLILVAHHFCIDAVSWNIVRSDLEASLRKERLAPKPSFADWAHEIKETANSNEVLKSIPFWNNQPYESCAKLKVASEINTEESAISLVEFLSKDITHKLAAQANTRENSIQVYLITALAKTLSTWLKQTHILMGIEGHGRNISGVSSDASSLVGWLTTYYPIVLDLEYCDSPARSLNDVRGQLAALPDQGNSFGIARYLSDSLNLKKIPTPEIAFNYLGRKTKGAISLDQSICADRNPSNRRSSIFEINALIEDDQLKIDWRFSEKQFEKATIRFLLSGLVQCLTRIVHSQQTVEKEYPIELSLSDSQEALLLHRLGNQNSDQGEIFLMSEVIGKLSKEDFQIAWSQLAQEHPAFRNRIQFYDDDNPKLVIDADPNFALEYTDLSTLTNEEQQRESESIEASVKHASLNLSEGPNMVLAIVHKGGDRHILYWKCHHIFVDGWSSGIVLSKLIAKLNGKEPNTDAEEEAFIHHQRTITDFPLSASARFWKQSLKNAAPTILAQSKANYPDSKRNVRSTVIPESIYRNLVSTARLHKTTPSAIATAAWAISLAKLTRQQSVTFATTFSGRNPDFPSSQNLVGNLANIAPIALSIDPTQSISGWTRDILTHLEATSQHAHFSISRVLDWAGANNGDALFDSLLNIANYPWDTKNQNVHLDNFKGDFTSTMPVSAFLSFSQNLALTIVVDTKWIPEPFAGELETLFIRKIEELASSTPNPVAVCIDFEFDKPRPQSRKPDSKQLNSKLVLTEDSTELITSIFREILNTSNCKSTDSFFELGGTSSQALQLFFAIEKTLGIRVPVSSLFRSATPRALANLIETNTDRPDSLEHLVEIKPGKGLPPLFLLHAVGSQILFYRDLAKYIDDRIPIYGIQPVGNDPTNAPVNDIKEMARRYLLELRQLFPKGPYAFAGHCFGATVSMEMSRILQSEGEIVPLVIAIDGEAPLPSGMLAPRMNTLFKGEKSVSQIYHFTKRELLKPFRQIGIRHLLKHGTAKQREAILEERNRVAVATAFRKYRADPYNGDLLAIQSVNAEDYSNHTKEHWLRAAPNMEMHRIDCQHHELLIEPNVQSTAKLIMDKLNTVNFINTKKV